MKAEHRELVRQALEARKRAYAPYSGYRVGAALLCEDGTVYTGCNIENAAYPVCNCAERTALFKAVSEGRRSFTAIAVAGGREEDAPLSSYAWPCGVCRQALMEFCDGSLAVITAAAEDDMQTDTLEGLLRNGFGGHSLWGKQEPSE